jgi:predicted adenine nucleotide alpha hydrolase (AANH) superfamily ATPase
MPSDEWYASQVENDMNDRWHWHHQSKGRTDHKGESAATCHACFKIDKSVTEHAAPWQADDARSHLSSQQWKEMFGK